MRRSVAVLAVLVSGLLGCASSDPGTPPEPSPRFDPARPFERAPLEQLPGSPVVADDASLWYCDFDRLAHLDLATGTWRTEPFPFDGDLGSLAFVSDGVGGLKGLAGTCAVACEEGVEVRFHAWQAAADGGPVEVPMPGPDLAVDDGYAVPLSIGRHASFQVVHGRATALVRWSARVEVEVVERTVHLVCAVGGTLVGVESLPADDGGEWDRSIVSGPDLAGLRTVDVGADLEAALASFDGGTACLPDGLAVVTSDRAWELRGGRWSSVPSDVGVPLVAQLLAGPAVVDDEGVVHQAGGSASLRRDDRGWHRAPDRAASGHVVIRGRAVAYPAA